MPEIINTTNLTKLYRDNHAVDDVNLSVKQGEIFGFIGLNGAGKTTTIRMLLGMISPRSGCCYLNGQKVSPSHIDIWRHVGYIVETPYSYPELTVRENLDIVRKLRDIKEKNRVQWIMNKLKLEEHASKKAKHLSLGNVQRLGIAKALIHKPKILLLDEPINGLDPAGIVEIRHMLLDLANNSGVTILISSHRLDEISKMATQIAIIHEGKIIKEIDGKQLNSQLSKTLVLDGKDKFGMQSVLSKAGYHATHSENEEYPTLQIDDEHAVNHPDKIAQLLVNSGLPPTLLKVQNEDLEHYFLRSIKEVGGKLNE